MSDAVFYISVGMVYAVNHVHVTMLHVLKKMDEKSGFCRKILPMNMKLYVIIINRI